MDDGGICTTDEPIRAQLYEAAYRLFEEQHADVLALRHRSSNDLDLPVRGSKVILSLALAAHPDTMRQRFDAKLRNQIRKAMTSGLTAVWSGREGLVDFYEVFAANMRDLGSPVHSLYRRLPTSWAYTRSPRRLASGPCSSLLPAGACRGC